MYQFYEPKDEARNSLKHGRSVNMNRIITIGREFGSGGRELGRRLAEALSFEFYDKEIIAQIARRTPFTEQYLREIEDRVPHILFPISVGKSFWNMSDHTFWQTQSVFHEQSALLKELAEKSDCVIVGRCADYVLHRWSPYRIFVYADTDSKIKRCKDRAAARQTLSSDQIRQNIVKIDKTRSKYYSFYTEQEWGKKENYDLCVNTSGKEIKKYAEMIAGLL